jgi:hypothetical protein
MAKFKKKSSTSQDIPTAALPDIIFMLLFFFMVTTVLRESTIMVKQSIPKATQLRKLEQKKLVSYLYVGSQMIPRNLELSQKFRPMMLLLKLTVSFSLLKKKKVNCRKMKKIRSPFH